MQFFWNRMENDIDESVERLGELFAALSAEGLEPKRLQLIQSRAETEPNLALVEARKGGGPGLRVLPVKIGK